MMKKNLTNKIAGIPALTAIILATAACTETRFEDATGTGVVRGVNASVDSSSVVFLNEEFNLGEITFKGATAGREWDNLSYTFNFDMAVPNQTSRERLASAFVDVVDQMDYTVVLAGPTSAATAFVWERPLRVWEGTETVLEIGFGHANSTLGPVDVYFLDAGNTPVLGGAAGTIDFGGFIVDAEFPAGAYDLVLTAPNDPTNVLFSGATVTLGGGDSFGAYILDADPGITAPVAVRAVSSNGTTIELSDSRFPPTVQFINAALAAGNIDVVTDSDFANPLVSNLPFGTVSADIDVPTDETLFSFATAGSTTPLVEDDIIVFAGSRSTFILFGEPGSEAIGRFDSNRRGIDTISQFRFIHTSVNGGNVDVYFLNDGETVDSRGPNLISVPFSVSTDETPQSIQSFDIAVTPTGEDTIFAGPVTVDFAANDIVEIVLLDTADPNVGELLIYSNISP